LARSQVKTRRRGVALIPNQVPPVLSVVAHLGRGVQRVATDAVLGRLRSLPRTIGDLDAAFLSQLMGRSYRQGALYPYVAALITAGIGGMQDEDIALEGLRRAVAALDDLDTVALLRKSL
jgi:hypothetical protein